jgi:hypothetical protein
MPIVRSGKDCIGSPAIPCREFAGVLDELLLEAQATQAVPSRQGYALARTG